VCLAHATVCHSISNRFHCDALYLLSVPNLCAPPQLIAKSAPLVDATTSFDAGGPLAAQATAPAAEPSSAFAHAGASAGHDDDAASEDGGESAEAPQHASALAGQQQIKRTKRANHIWAFLAFAFAIVLITLPLIRSWRIPSRARCFHV
jgi:hypothetical protein